MEPNKKQRIVFLDMMRFIALFQMIQGHTIYALLDKSILKGDSPAIQFWTYLRGYTAPFFMVIAGAVFTFLLIQEKPLSGPNPRIKKGMLRIVTLFFWGYLLRFPIQLLTRLHVTQRALENALAFDVLQLIGAGLLVVTLIFMFVGIKRLSLMLLYLGLFLTVAFVSPYVAGINFHNDLPKFFSLWINDFPTLAGKSSPFPIFPWIAYLLFGGFFGAWLSFQSKKDNFQKNIDIKLLIVAILLYCLARFGEWIDIYRFGESVYWGKENSLGIPLLGQSESVLFDRIAFVLFVGVICAFIARFIKKLPHIMAQMSRNTLWLYVGHLIVLYWIRPLFTHARYNFPITLLCVAGMFALMVLQTKIIEKKNKMGSWKSFLSVLKF
jgi:uncharacterized membrane protein